MAFSLVTFVNLFAGSPQPITSLATSRSFPLVSSLLSNVYSAKNRRERPLAVTEGSRKDEYLNKNERQFERKFMSRCKNIEEDGKRT